MSAVVSVYFGVVEERELYEHECDYATVRSDLIHQAL